MGLRSVMMLGWSGEQIIEKAKELHIVLDPTNEDSFYTFDANEINQMLADIQRNIIQDILKFTILEENNETFGSKEYYSFEVETPLGNERLDGMRLTTCGSYFNENMISLLSFGIQLNGTFNPVLLDWEGVRGEGQFQFHMTEEKMKLFQRIKKEIVKTYPVFQDAEWVIQSDWV